MVLYVYRFDQLLQHEVQHALGGLERVHFDVSKVGRSIQYAKEAPQENQVYELV